MCPPVAVLSPFGRQARIETFGQGAKGPRCVAKKLVFPFELVQLVLAVVESRYDFPCSLVVILGQSFLLLAATDLAATRSRIGQNAASARCSPTPHMCARPQVQLDSSAAARVKCGEFPSTEMTVGARKARVEL